MQTKDIKKTIKIILSNLKGKTFIWRLEGSANLVIQGVDTTVRDLDITTNYEGIKIFREALKKFIVKDFISEKINGRSIVCDILGFEVEINYYGDRTLNMFDKSKKIIWQNLEIPILPLKYAKQFYETIKRTKKVELISRYL
ncbi:hypothetical protein HN385_02550 [archaeon]|jgi:hypothetical protein|nr:hypothetical protein [archaeon]MBT3450798.1 hypothetical protein [archaeon]MBT6868789.1 hypothetical protein [archaeon]MBT7192990.1 hypothetical protein [archaeon]MBT7380956.1 hypothetical protein [archaeon]